MRWTASSRAHAKAYLIRRWEPRPGYKPLILTHGEKWRKVSDSIKENLCYKPETRGDP